jgi:hypothetical protein
MRLALLGILLLVGGAQAAGFQVDSPDHPGTMLVYDDLYGPNNRTSYAGDVLRISFDYRTTRASDVILTIPPQLAQGAQASAQGLKPGPETRQVPNALAALDPASSHFTMQPVTATGLGPATVISPTQKEGDTWEGPRFAVAAAQKVHFEGEWRLPADIAARNLTLWDLDQDGSFRELLGAIALRHLWPEDDDSVTVEPEVLLLVQIRLSTGLTFGIVETTSGASLRSDTGTLEGISIKAKSKEKVWLPKPTKERDVSITNRVHYKLNEPLRVLIHLEGELARHVVQLYVNGEPLRTPDGLPWLWSGEGASPSWAVLPAGDHDIEVRVRGVKASHLNGEVVLSRPGVIEARIPVEIVHTQDNRLAWLLVALALALTGWAAWGLRPPRFYVVGDGGYCSYHGRVVGETMQAGDQAHVVRLRDLPLASESDEEREAKATAIAERYPLPVLQLLKRNEDGNLIPHAARNHGARIAHIAAEAASVRCGACPMRPACWNPAKRGA